LFRSAGLDLNFAGGVFSLNNTRTASPANIPGWSFSRTDTNGIATALDLAGNVIQFATGVPRITNRGILVEEARTNLLLNSATLSTQTVTTTAVAHTLSFYGTGTVTLTGASTAGPLVGTGANNRVTLTFTPIVGPLLLTVTGSVTLAQVELGAFATSPIITTGAAGTRGADAANQTLLTIPAATFFQGSVDNLAANMRPWEMHGGSDVERVFIQVTSGGALNAFVITGSVAVVTISTPAATITAGTTFKALLRRSDAGTWRLFINGVAVGSESAVAALPSVTTLGIGRRRTNVEYLNGFAARLRLFPTPPSDADSLALTAP
jgi:hypothetical protein